jgi:porphobilinogen synthase
MLIQPFFVDQRLKSKKIIKGMGNNYSWSQSAIIKGIESDLKKGIKKFLLFIVPKEKQKLPENFSYHYEIIRNLKKEFHKDITLLVDTCLCSITPDGHCGISHKRKIDLNQTHYALGLAANTYLEAGADIIAPSDMMKNTTRYLRKIFQDNNFSNAQIMSYSTKFKSSFYGPFRNAANSSPKGFDRSSYQLPVNHRKKALESSIVNAAQGANYLMVKPGMTSIDLIADIKKETLLPTGAYQVSGEFASLQLLHKNKLGNYQDLLFESLQVFARAKADFIITYGARDIAKYL